VSQVGDAEAVMDLSRKLGTEKEQKKYEERMQTESKEFLQEILNYHLRLCDDAKLGVQTILTDTGTALIEAALYAHFGRNTKIWPYERPAAADEVKRFIQHPKQHMIITHWEKSEWVGDKSTGRTIRNGWRDIGYLVNVELSHWRVRGVDEAENLKTIYRLAKKPAIGTWVMELDKCMPNPKLVGTPDGVFLNEDCSFIELCARIYGQRKGFDFKRDLGYTQEELERHGFA
jgi:hypothetical protein